MLGHVWAISRIDGTFMYLSNFIGILRDIWDVARCCNTEMIVWLGYEYDSMIGPFFQTATPVTCGELDFWMGYTEHQQARIHLQWYIPFSSYKRAEKHITPQQLNKQTSTKRQFHPFHVQRPNNLHVLREKQIRHQELATVFLHSFGCFLTHVPLP